MNINEFFDVMDCIYANNQAFFDYWAQSRNQRIALLHAELCDQHEEALFCEIDRLNNLA